MSVDTRPGVADSLFLLNNLEDERVKSAERALTEIKTRELNYHPNTFHYLLIEEFRTQQSLKNGGLKVPGTGMLHTPNNPDPEFKNKNLIIEVLGDPLGGKTTLIVGGIRYKYR
jgi:hypothetical protein